MWRESEWGCTIFCGVVNNGLDDVECIDVHKGCTGELGLKIFHHCLHGRVEANSIIIYFVDAFPIFAFTGEDRWRAANGPNVGDGELPHAQAVCSLQTQKNENKTKILELKISNRDGRTGDEKFLKQKQKTKAKIGHFLKFSTTARWQLTHYNLGHIVHYAKFLTPIENRTSTLSIYIYIYVIISLIVYN